MKKLIVMPNAKFVLEQKLFTLEKEYELLAHVGNGVQVLNDKGDLSLVPNTCFE